MRLPRVLGTLPILALLMGCNAAIVNPAGDMTLRERDLIIASTGLMLLIIVPVIVVTILFAWRYRASNTEATYEPDWHHSTQLEVLIWTAPLLIIIALGALTWYSTHLLDPFRGIGRIDASRPIAPELKPLTVEVVALDWKWLFFYPDQGIATVNELAAPIDTPINFKITSATVMNSFFIPAVAGQVYAMAGMETKLHAVVNKQGSFTGLSSQYSGAGFSRMNFKTIGMTPSGFRDWIAKVKNEGKPLDQDTYLQLEKPSEATPVTYFSTVKDGLYDAILNLCAIPGKMCQDEMMHIDATGGGGLHSEENYARLRYDGHRSEEGVEQPGATFPASGRPPNSNVQPEGMKPRAISPEKNEQKTQPDEGQGENMPGMDGMPGMSKKSPAPAQLNSN